MQSGPLFFRSLATLNSFGHFKSKTGRLIPTSTLPNKQTYKGPETSSLAQEMKSVPLVIGQALAGCL